MNPSRPAADEYDPFYETYVSKVEGDGALDLLESQVSATREMFTGMSDSAAKHRYADGKWSIKEVLGHLIDGERVFTYRALCVARGEKVDLPGMDESVYVVGGRFEARSIESLLSEWEAVRQSTLTLFDSFDEEAWQTIGSANQGKISPRALAYIVAGHQKHHMGVLEERYLSNV